MNLHLVWVVISGIRAKPGLYWTVGFKERGSLGKEICGQNFFEKDGMDEV